MLMEFASITVSYFIHSTEDLPKLISCVGEAFGLLDGEVQTDNVQGHFGNEMTFAKAHLTGKRANVVSDRIIHSLTKDSRIALKENLERSIDEHDSLYLRIDRQSLGKGFSLSDEEPIRIKLKPKLRIGGRRAMIDSYRELFG